MPARYKFPANLAKVLQHPIFGTFSPVVRINGFKNQGMKTVVTLPDITHSDPLTKLLLPVPMTLCSAGLRAFLPKGGMFQPGDTQ
jgi:hypothetical protein